MIQTYSPPTIFQARTVLTNDLILTLVTVPQTVVPNPGNNKIAVPLSAIMFPTIITPYTPDDASNYYMIGTGVDDSELMTPLLVSDVAGTGQIRFLGMNYYTDTSGLEGSLTPTSQNAADLINRSLSLFIGAEANPTDGDAANLLVITVAYLILDVTTGLFE